MTNAALTRRSFISDLRTVLGGSGFRKLYATRLISQTGDGIFTSGLGTYVFFNQTTYPDPGKAAVSFAVLYLPYSLIGPFAGVFIDRWSRRQILAWSAVIRASFVVLAAVFIGTGALGLPVWLSVLVVLGVNRFFLSSLSAALPHVVAPDELVMANSVGPTSGTIMGFVGGGIGLAVHWLTGGGQVGSAITLLTAGVCYLLASLSATRIARDALGPDRDPAGPESAVAAAESLAAGVMSVAAGLIAGLRHVWHRPQARAAMSATAAHRFFSGALLLMVILLYRNYFYPGSSANGALGHFIPVVASTGLGYAAAALITPVATRKLSNAAWITVLLAAAGLVIGGLGVSFGPVEFIVMGFALGMIAQGITICTTTILQQETEDDFRGRVFSVNDMLFNTMFVAGAALSAAFMPVSGHSVPILLVVAGGYLVAAGGYRIMAGRSQPGQRPPGQEAPGDPPCEEPAPASRPDSRAQRSSS